LQILLPSISRTTFLIKGLRIVRGGLLKTHRFNRREDIKQTLLRYTALYNNQLPQSVLTSKTPMQTVKE